MILACCHGIKRSEPVRLRTPLRFVETLLRVLLLWTLAALSMGTRAQPAAAWKLLPSQLNTPRAYLAAVTGRDGRIYAIAGRDGSGKFLSSMEVYDPAHPNLGWTALPSQLNTPRAYLAAVTGSNGKIYAVGGYDAAFNLLGSVEVYDPVHPTANWTLLHTSLNVARTYLAAVNGPDGKIYAIGGRDSNLASLSSVERYNPDTPAAGWTLLASRLNTARPRLTAVVGEDRKIYAIGGTDSSAAALGSTEVYDPAHSTQGWTIVASPLNFPRSTLASTADPNGKLYALGGRDSNGSTLSSVEVYDPSNPAAGWSALPAQLNVARNFLGAVTDLDGKLYVIGGRDSSQTPLNSVEVYDTSIGLPHTHLLWSNADGHAVLWNINAYQEAAPSTGNRFTFSAPFGPFSGWQPAGLTAGPDGNARLLWNHPADGMAALWNVDAATFISGNPVSFFVYGPFAGWNALAAGVGTDGDEHLFWGTSTDQGSYAALWDIPGPSSAYSTQVYGPYSGWTPVSLSATPDANVNHLLWNYKDGSADLWTVDAVRQVARSPIYGPYTGWTATQVAGSVSGTRYLLWTKTDGSISLWRVDSTGNHQFYAHSVPTYGPFPGWKCVSLCSDPAGTPRLLWTSVDGTAAMWHMKPDGTYSLQVYGPYPGWTCLAASAGP